MCFPLAPPEAVPRVQAGTSSSSLLPLSDGPPVPAALWQIHMLSASGPTLSGLQKLELRVILIHLSSCSLSDIGIIAILCLFRVFFLRVNISSFLNFSKFKYELSQS